MFHGYRDTALVAEQMTGFSTLADTFGFIAVYPQAAGPPAKWDVKGETDLEFVEAILEGLAEDGCADGSRVFAVGFSMGGAMATALGCRMADRVAAVASVSGLYGPNWAEPCTATRPVPIIAFHGAVDPQVPYTGGVIDDGREPDLPDVMAVESWAALWAERNGCDPDARLEAQIGEVEPLVWDGCVAPVRLYRIQDGGHTWPGSVLAEPMTNRDISASELIWQFLRMSHLAS